MRRSSCVLLCLFAGMVGNLPASHAAPADRGKMPGFQPVEPVFLPDLVQVTDVPGLPRVLLIGDSISIGYTRAVRAQLAGRANVHRPGENCGDTFYGLERLEDWLGAGPWTIIHFNFGLHDLKYLDEQGNYVARGQGRQVASLDEYGRNLRELVKRLHRTGARLIFATTTPVPAGAPGRVEGSEQAYNEVALRVMRENGVGIDDLNAYVRSRPPGIHLPHNVHFTPAGYDELARVVAGNVESALPTGLGPQSLRNAAASSEPVKPLP